MKRLAFAALLLLTSCHQVNPNRTQFGFNTFNYILGAAQQAGFATPQLTYASNAVAYPMPVVTNNLSFLAGHGVHVAREIIPELALEDAAIFQAMLPVVQAYAANGFTLILALGRPASGEDLSNGQINCMITSQWPATATRWANALAAFITYLGANGVPTAWLASHLMIDPYNEFDSVLDDHCAAGWGTPQRAVQLSRALASLPATVLAPSLATGNYGPYLMAFYAAGGHGCPNIHIYYTATEDKLAFTQQLLADTAATAPQCKVVLGEFGVATANATDDAIGATLVNGLAAAAPPFLSIALWWDYMSPDDWATSPPSVMPDLVALHATARAIIQADQ